MQHSEISEKSLQQISDTKLVNLHFKMHQLYGIFIKRKDVNSKNELIKAHNIVVRELEKRNLDHKTPLPTTLEFYLYRVLKRNHSKCQNQRTKKL